MAFIDTMHKGRTYAPGWFLAHEECTRKTREIPQSMAVTAENGAKYVPMGTVYPANDSTAEGIIYEDVDVTAGNMPGSVVTKGEVYVDRMAITAVSYDAVTPVGSENPVEEKWYERSGSAGAYVYTLSEDTTVDSSKTYYEQTVTTISSDAKTALAAKGFVFVEAAPTITRP